MAAAFAAPGGLSNPNPEVYTPSLSTSNAAEPQDAAIAEIFDLIRDIKDPEHPHTLEELRVVDEAHITVHRPSRQGEGKAENRAKKWKEEEAQDETKLEEEEADEELWIRIEFTPTVRHCSLATLIGLCLRVKLERSLQTRFKLDIVVSEGTHSIEGDVNKQINDKERVAAAMENPSLRDVVEDCIKDVEY